MDLKQAINEIKSRTKPYLNIKEPIRQDTFSKACKRCLDGSMSIYGIKKFLEKFGYKVIIEIKIERNEEV